MTIRFLAATIWNQCDNYVQSEGQRSLLIRGFHDERAGPNGVNHRLYPRESEARWLFRRAHGTWHVISPAEEKITGCEMTILSHWEELPLPDDMRALFQNMKLVEVGKVCLACARVAGLYTG